jgi:glyoxylase-like metal-dependent hydrolase (beta-lactamase superfamily II)
VVLVDGTEPIVVDTGAGENKDAILGSIGRLTKGHKVDRIVLTHRHYDHVGGADAMSAALGAKLYAHPIEAAILRDGDPWQTLSVMFGAPGVALDVADLKVGAKLSTGSHEFTVLHTPGHTSGSISLFEETSGILISGDTVFADGVGRWDLPSGDEEALKRSLVSLSGLEITDIYPGHGPCVKGKGMQSIKGAMRYLGE